MKFFKTIFIDDWKIGYFIIALVAFMFDVVIPENYVDLTTKVHILCWAIAFGFILKLSFQLYNYKESDFFCSGYNSGSGIYASIELLKVKSDARLHRDLMLVLYDNSTSISSPVGVVRIVDIDNNFAYGELLGAEGKQFTKIFEGKDEKNFVLKNKIHVNVFTELSNRK